MRVSLTRRALADAKRKKTWWHLHRPDAGDLFEKELEATLEHIAAAPGLGQRVEERGRGRLRAPVVDAEDGQSRLLRD